MTSKIKIFLGCIFGFCVLMNGVSFAQYTSQYSSSHYKVNETFFGAGGDLNNASAHYSAKTAAGEIGVGLSSSPNFKAYAGFNTTNTILMELIVNGGRFDMGVLDENQVHTQQATFSVKDYLSTGYTIQIMGRPPSNSGHELTPMSTANSSSPGTEQFGLNLAANNLTGVGPFGAAPSQVPDSTFGFGQADSPYGTSNLFKFVEGDTVAHSDTSTGETLFTLSFIANISHITPGGAYGGSLFVRVIPTY